MMELLWGEYVGVCATPYSLRQAEDWDQKCQAPLYQIPVQPQTLTSRVVLN